MSLQMGNWVEVTFPKPYTKSVQSEALNWGNSGPELTPCPSRHHLPSSNLRWKTEVTTRHALKHGIWARVDTGLEWLPNRIFLPKIHLAVQLPKRLFTSLRITLTFSCCLPQLCLPLCGGWNASWAFGTQSRQLLLQPFFLRLELPKLWVSTGYQGDATWSSRNTQKWTSSWCSAVAWVVSSALSVAASSLCFYLFWSYYYAFRKWISKYIFFPIVAIN